MGNRSRLHSCDGSKMGAWEVDRRLSADPWDSCHKCSRGFEEMGHGSVFEDGDTNEADEQDRRRGLWRIHTCLKIYFLKSKTCILLFLFISLKVYSLTIMFHTNLLTRQEHLDGMIVAWVDSCNYSRMVVWRPMEYLGLVLKFMFIVKTCIFLLLASQNPSYVKVYENK